MGSPLPLPLLSVSFSEHRIVGQQGERYPENKAQGAEPLLSLTSTRLFSQILSSFFLNFVGVTRDPRWGVAASYQEQEPPRGTSSDIRHTLRALDCYANYGYATFGDEIWKTIRNLEFRRAG